jgi:hypothetical protein
LKGYRELFHRHRISNSERETAVHFEKMIQNKQKKKKKRKKKKKA